MGEYLQVSCRSEERMMIQGFVSDFTICRNMKIFILFKSCIKVYLEFTLYTCDGNYGYTDVVE